MPPQNHQSPAAPVLPTISDGLLGLITRRMWLLSDPIRVRLLLLLAAGEASVQRLVEEIGGTTHQNVSRNLNLLYRDGLLARRREGTLMLYSLADYTAGRLLTLAGQSVAARIDELGDLVGG